MDISKNQYRSTGGVSTLIEDTGKDYLGNISKALVRLTQGEFLMFKKVKSQEICKSQGAFDRNMCFYYWMKVEDTN